MSPADVVALTGNRNDGMFGDGNGAWWIIILFLFAFCGGWGNNGFGGNGGGAAENYVLASDFATLQRQIDSASSSLERKGDSIINGLADGFYSQMVATNGVNMNIATNGYETRNAITQAQIGQMQSANALQAQIAQCCCDVREGIGGVSNTLGRAIENGFAQTNYNMATQNCATLTAIDKVGDRIIDYISNEKMQSLRDENQALRLAASQERQNSILIDQLAPKCPIPAYLTCNPNAPLNYSINYGGCGCGA